MTVRAYNPTASPVVIDAKGHSLPGREWGDINPDDEIGAAALAAGDLLLEETATSDAPPKDDPAPPSTPRAPRRAPSKE